jgi:hypothetical protein
MLLLTFSFKAILIIIVGYVMFNYLADIAVRL